MDDSRRAESINLPIFEGLRQRAVGIISVQNLQEQQGEVTTILPVDHLTEKMKLVWHRH